MKVEQGFGHFSTDLRIAPLIGRFIWYQHLFPTPRNIDLVNQISVANPVITYREVFGWVLSMANFIARELRSPWGLRSDTTLFQPPTRDNPNLNSILTYVVDFELPIYLRFLNGWMHAELALPAVWISFSNLTGESVIADSLLRREAGWPIPEYTSWPVTGEKIVGAHRTRAENIALIGARNRKRIDYLVEQTSLKWLLQE